MNTELAIKALEAGKTIVAIKRDGTQGAIRCLDPKDNTKIYVFREYNNSISIRDFDDLYKRILNMINYNYQMYRGPKKKGMP